MSVVVPCYRSRDTVRAAIASVAAQTVRPAEVLLVDDSSGDGTLEVLQALARKYPEGWIRVIAMERNGGPSAARNAAWDVATQEYVAFLDADDSWHPRKIELQLAALRADPTLVLVGHLANVQPVDAAPPPLRAPIRTRLVRPTMMLFRNPFPTPTVMLRRDVPFRFDAARRRAEDYLLWAQLVLSGRRCAIINQSLASLHKPPFGAGGLSADLAAMNRAGIEVRNELKAQGLLTARQLLVAHTISRLRQARRHAITFLRNLRKGLSVTDSGAPR